MINQPTVTGGGPAGGQPLWGIPRARSRTMDTAALFAQHGDRLYRFCLRLCGGRATDAEDLAQEVFLAAHRGAEKFGGRSSPLTWLYGIALTQWRHRQARSPPPTAPWGEVEETPAPRADPARSVPGDLALADALAALPGELREAFLLVKAEGLKYKEAASVLDVPQGTVQWRVHEASKRLRALLTEEEEDHAL